MYNDYEIKKEIRLSIVKDYNYNFNNDIYYKPFEDYYNIIDIDHLLEEIEEFDKNTLNKIEE